MTQTFRFNKAWIGIDADIETSLFEYGVICRKNKHCSEPDEHFCLYLTKPDLFDWGYKKESELNDLINGSDWMKDKDVESFLSYVGMPKADWLQLTFINKLHDLFSYYGYENIMGSTYSPLRSIDIKKLIR